VGQQRGCPLALGSALTHAVQRRLSVDASRAHHGKAALATNHTCAGHTYTQPPRRHVPGVHAARAPPD